MTNSVIENFSTLTADLVEKIYELETKVFDKPLSKDAIISKLENRRRVLLLVAKQNNKPVGYKIGYEHSPEVFYSWIGGIDPSYRRHGIATSLMKEQHRILKELGYKYVRTSTKNKYREMLILNIKYGFDITGIQNKLGEKEQSILLEKVL